MDRALRMLLAGARVSNRSLQRHVNVLHRRRDSHVSGLIILRLLWHQTSVALGLRPLLKLLGLNAGSRIRVLLLKLIMGLLRRAWRSHSRHSSGFT